MNEISNYDNHLIPNDCFAPDPLYIVSGSEFGNSDLIESFQDCEEFIIEDIKDSLTRNEEPPLDYSIYNEPSGDLNTRIDSFLFFTPCSNEECNTLIFNPNQYYSPLTQPLMLCKAHSTKPLPKQLEIKGD